ncbi:hypothetical protein C8A03DRAFT_38605 [Achaetomium macrosporum]|uniref:Uncharacterized protein n=1 Tax=Achaetomium macrosporum TaxID=79813 RepID=A0AAN7HAC4_9PEZI|nr:hypothetical protein C8A03DRAFT_38605 [Achaetomium macrosporum]
MLAVGTAVFGRPGSGASEKSDAGRSAGGQQPPGVSYYAYETSAKQIYSRRGKILDNTHLELPAPWKELLTEKDAEQFVRTRPVRDASRHFAQSRFRILVVQYSNMKLLYRQEFLLKAAKAAGWITTVFETFMENHTTGSAFSESSDGLNFMAQTPHDDMFPFFSLSLSAHHGYGYENAPDWTAIIFLGPSPKRELDIGVLSSLLSHEKYPDDFPPSLSPDLMVLAVALMRYQVTETASEVAKMRRDILEVDEQLLDPKVYKMERLRKVKARLFALRRTQGSLYQRHLFTAELASNLGKTFEALRKRGRGELEDRLIQYPSVLREAVQALSFILETLEYEVKVAAPRIEAQQTMLDGQTNIMIANNSYRVAEEARRDSASMKTIAVVTLVFLPGTFVAAIFSMSMFQWMPDEDSNDDMAKDKDSSRIVSQWFWLYWAITVPLTIGILICWVLWFKRWERKWRQEHESDEEDKIK